MEQNQDNNRSSAIGAVHVGYANPHGLDWLGHHRDTGSSTQLWGARSDANSVAIFAAVGDDNKDQLVPGIACQTTYADLARISPNALWVRWVGDRSECTIGAREAFLAARAIPVAGLIPPPDASPNTAMLVWALKDMLSALPERRDWFNPDAEKVLRAFVDAAPADPAPGLNVEPVEIRPEDLRLETWRKNRGGWDTRPDNCCRLTHVPTGITVTVEGDDNARSIHAAKAEAMRKLELEMVARASHSLPIADESNKDVDEWLHRFIDQLAEYVDACVEQNRPDALPENAGRARPMYQKLYRHVRSAVMNLFELRKRAAPELAQLQGAVVAAAHKLREAGQGMLAQKLENSAVGVELVLQPEQSSGDAS
jgi:hypothetical protein